MRLFELNSDDNTVYFCFMNSNPPTLGYKLAIDALKEYAGESDHMVFINPAQDDDISPLDFKTNLAYNKKVFTNTTFDTTGKAQNPIQALQILSKKYNKIYLLTRDSKVRDFKRLETYAESWGVEDFEVIGLGDSKRSLPIGTTKEEAFTAVDMNDFDKFKKTIPSKNSQLMSQIFLDLRKIMIDAERKEETDGVDESTAMTFDVLKEMSYFSNTYITESCSKDMLENKVLNMETIIPTFDSFKIVFNENSNKTIKLAKDKSDGKYAFIFKTKPELLESFLSVNESSVKKALRFYITESASAGSTASGNIAGVNMMFGDIVKREIDFSAIENMDFNKAQPKYIQAVNKVLNTYGYMDAETAAKLRTYLNE